MTTADDAPLGLDDFEQHRSLLHGIAYRMLGSAADADDILQEARIRWLAARKEEIVHVRSYLVTIVSRLCLDELGSARKRRETYIGPWLPEPVVTPPEADPDSLSVAFLMLLERLSPAERATFLLAEVFDYELSEVARILGKSEDACRQLAVRARKHVHSGRVRPIDREDHTRTLQAFVSACSTGDLAGLERLLAADVVAHSDSGGRATAARKLVRGAPDVARLTLGLLKKGGSHASYELVHLNGLPAIIGREHGRVTSAVSLAVADGQIHAIYTTRNPDKLARLDRVS